MSGLAAVNAKPGVHSAAASKLNRRKPDGLRSDGAANGHLSPSAANKNYWRELSRSPSPLGLIPIHQEWRNFVRVSGSLSSFPILTTILRFIAMKSPAKFCTCP